MGTHFAIKVFTCMKMTLSLIKADIGGIGGHTKPSEKLLETVRNFVKEKGEYLLTDHRVYHTGDDVAILMTHTNGEGNEKVHQLAWDAFVAGTETAKSEGLYGAGQDLLKDAFTGNIQGMGPGVAFRVCRPNVVPRIDCSTRDNARLYIRDYRHRKYRSR
mgnify:CR=1 FL=1